MKIKIEGLGMAYSEATPEDAAKRVAEQFGVLVEFTGERAGGGWPEVNVIGTPQQLIKAITEEAGWSTGDAAEDAEMLYYLFKDAKQIFG